MHTAIRILVAGCLLLGGLTAWAQAPTTINDFFLPGSQPNESGTIEKPDRCENCHGGYDQPVEPAFNWRGSMMSQAMRDPLFLACMAIAEQDAPGSGDLCIRCHTPKGWLEGRSEPTDGSALTADDRDGVQCDACHRMVKPTDIGVNPYPGDSAYTATTYSADQTYLQTIVSIPDVEANGGFVADSDANPKRGPYDVTVARHAYYPSPFHFESGICGNCHDVSNPAFTRDSADSYSPNAFDAPHPDSANPYAMFPIERTFSEWKMSAYNTPEGVYAPQFGGNKDTVRSCQDCHMRDVTGAGCDKNDAPIRNDLGLHDMTGGNTFIPLTISDAFPGETSQEALDSGIVRARRMLQLATSMDVVSTPDGSQHRVTVTVTNETGHKLPSGYPEGRRMWLNVRAYDGSANLVYESCAYDTATADLSHDPDAKIYEVKLGITEDLAAVVNRPSGIGFHFALNDTVFKDNRIPPRGFTNANFEYIQSAPKGYSYADGQYWDDTEYLIPGNAAEIEVTLYYQTTSKEYVEFLRDANVTNSAGQTMYDLWVDHGKSTPEVMNAQTITVTPIAGNQPPVLDPIGDKSVDENSLLAFTVTATDPDGTTPSLSAESLPTGASFTDNGDGSGDFSWTPTYDQSGAYDVTFKAIDDSAAVDSEVVTITVNNVNRPPVLDSIGPQTTDEDVLLTFAVTASDPDGTIPELSADSLPTGATFSDNGDGTGDFSWTPTYDQSGSYDVIFIAEDELAADSEIVTITVNNVNRPPVLDSIGPKTTAEETNLNFTVTASDPDGTVPSLDATQLPSGATFTDNSDGTGVFDWTPGPEQAGSYDVIFAASDGIAADSETVTITVNETNQPPVLDPIGPQSVDENTLLAFTVTASDPDGTTPSLVADSLPVGATLTDNADGTGDFSWTPTYDQAGSYNVVVIASDGIAADSETVAITVNDVNRAPVLDPIGNKNVTAETTLDITVTASDPDGTTPNIFADSLPATATFTDHGDGTATFSWTPAIADEGDHNVLFSASDGALADSELVTITVSVDNSAPVLDPIGDQTAIAGELLTFEITGHDPDADSVMFWAENLPAGATLTENGWDAGQSVYTATFEWLPEEIDVGTHSGLRFVADDGALIDDEFIAITVESGFICGDVNGSGDGPNVADITYFVDFLFRGGAPPPDPDAADVNGSGAINVTDLTVLVDFVFRGGPEPTCGQAPVK